MTDFRAVVIGAIKLFLANFLAGKSVLNIAITTDFSEAGLATGAMLSHFDLTGFTDTFVTFFLALMDLAV